MPGGDTRQRHRQLTSGFVAVANSESAARKALLTLGCGSLLRRGGRRQRIEVIRRSRLAQPDRQVPAADAVCGQTQLTCPSVSCKRHVLGDQTPCLALACICVNKPALCVCSFYPQKDHEKNSIHDKPLNYELQKATREITWSSGLQVGCRN